MARATGRDEIKERFSALCCQTGLGVSSTVVRSSVNVMRMTQNVRIIRGGRHRKRTEEEKSVTASPES